MARALRTSRLRRPLVAALVVALHAGLIALLLRPMLLPAPQPAESLILVDVPPPPPLPPPPDPAQAQRGPVAPPAPPAPRKRPRPDAAPAPPIPAPGPVAAAPADGDDSAAGSATAGAGMGASGKGLGSGSGGDGQGGGGSSRPRWESGRIERRDYPPDASRAGATGSVTATLDIAPDGRVSGCRIARSSGNASLDRTTCRLIQQRFRFEPARDAAGNPVQGVAGWRQDWWLEPPR